MKLQYIGLSVIALIGVSGVASADFGTNTLSTFADNANGGDGLPIADQTLGSGITAQFRSGGIVAPTSGTRFLNAQNTGSSFDSWAAIRWDLSDLYAAINAEVAGKPGATGAVIKSVELGLYQSPFSASSQSTFGIHYIEDDSTDFDPQNVAGQFGAFGGPTIDFSFFTGGNSFVTTGFFDNVGPVGARDAFDIGSSDVIADLNDFSDNFLTLALQAASGNASYGGSSPFGERFSPELKVTYNIIPTPGAAALFGLAGLVGLRRRRA
ncbi:MAG: hypothetical protein EA376_04770 [Phycisphaeraceae bacterium]|nr:MAG: hypothetical protein EA376_04770 [Phycisphaeraceae bacterium]